MCEIIGKIAAEIAQFSSDSDVLGDAYEYLIGQFAAGAGKKAGGFYTPQPISSVLWHIVTPDNQDPVAGKKIKLDRDLDFACGPGSLLLNVRNRMGAHRIGKIYRQEKNVTTYNLARMNMLLHGLKGTEFAVHHGDSLDDDWSPLREMNPAKSSASMPSSPIRCAAIAGRRTTPSPSRKSTLAQYTDSSKLLIGASAMQPTSTTHFEETGLPPV